jgi:hypothetical protein
MAEEKLILIEADATNAVGFHVDEIKSLDYEERQSGVGTVQLLRIVLKSGKKLTYNDAEATTVYTTIKDSFSEGGTDASPAPIEVTQAAIDTAMQLIAEFRGALSSIGGGVFIRIGTDGVPLELDAS